MERMVPRVPKKKARRKSPSRSQGPAIPNVDKRPGTRTTAWYTASMTAHRKINKLIHGFLSTRPLNLSNQVLGAAPLSGVGIPAAAYQYCGTNRLKPSIMPKCRRFLVTSVRPSSIAVAAIGESKTCSP